MTILNETLPADKLGFGIYFCPKMIVSEYKDGKWSTLEITETKDLQLSPGAKVLHYAQEIFEGLKAYKQNDGSIAMFRPDANISRMNHSARMLSMPEFNEADFMEGLKKVTSEAISYAPDAPGSIYLRPTMFSTSPSLGVQPGNEYLFYILVSPVGGYFGSAHADKPVQVSVLATKDYVRAVKGGLGSAKTGGNYAASLRAIQHAKENGFNNVLFMDAIDQRHIEELGGMNFFAVINGELHTPELTDSILAGVTRDSILKLASDLGIKSFERRIDINDLIKGIGDGSVEELFACGTAAVVTSITSLGWNNEKYTVNGGETGSITSKMFKTLTDIHYGRAEAKDSSWIVKI